ncbi:fungal transcriptional regulatory protein [Scheffersomyces coipomensis]|uniref:fungal transcriptional regulatory protein n=1 Tax=Scheffersomyces coipomensis TaxID=1788519 RepID=UPI00315D6017
MVDPLAPAPPPANQSTRKRNRVTLVCNVCKFRKVKCDRNSPCNSCIKYNTADVCSYTEPYNGDHPTVNSISTPGSLSSPGLPFEYPTHQEYTTPSKNRIFLVAKSYSDIYMNLKDAQSYVGINPIGSPDETINFHRYSAISEGPDQTLQNSGPLTFCAIMRLDPALFDLWSFLSLQSKDFNAQTEALMSSLQEQLSKSNDPTGFSKHFNWSNTPFQVLQRINISAIKMFDPAQHKINNFSVPLGLNFISDEEIRSGKDFDLKLNILKVLPTKRVIWIHVNRFFKFIYPFIPLLDEVSFKEQIAKLIGEESFSDDKVTEINIQENLDYAYIGILLVVLRMSYLGLISNNKEVDNFNLNFISGMNLRPPQNETHQLTDNERKNLRMLLENSIGIEVIVLARSCLNQFQLFQKINLTILQLALFMRMYIFIAPEDSEGPDQNQFQTFTGTLISMAYSIGLHRDPKTFTDIEMEPKLANLRRKIWFQLNFIDLFESFSYGVPLTTQIPFADAKFPCDEKTNNNITFSNLEKYTIESWKILDPILIKLRLILNEILNVNREVSMPKLVEQLNDLEIFVAKYLGSNVESFLSSTNRDSNDTGIDKYLQLHNYIQIKFFFVSIYHHFYIYYEKLGNTDLTNFYLKKIFSILIEEFLPQYARILDMQHYYFNYAANLFLNPILESAMHRASGFMMSLIVRLNYSIRVLTKVKHAEHAIKMEKDRDYKTYFENLEELLYFCNKSVKLNTLYFVRLGNRYLHSWRVSKCHIYLLKAIDSDEFYTAFDAKADGEPESESISGLETKQLLFKFNLNPGLVADLSTVIYTALAKLRYHGGSKVREEWTEFYGPATHKDMQTIAKIESRIDKDGIKRRKLTDDGDYQENFEIPKFNDTFSVDTPTSNLDNVLERYYALDDPHFEIFNKLPLSKLLDSFDGSK